ncbi:MAG: 2-C-methyl-D-erythritol 4-phosphate cytidylyltransferase [Desulfatirhabdiaceae bacterium]
MITTAIIVAAGRGIRMGETIPKQYLMLAGHPIICHTLTAFNACDAIDRMVWVVPEADLDFCRQNILPQATVTKPVHLVPGGKERQESVYQGLLTLGPESDNLVVIHDGVRPLIRSDQITACIRVAQKKHACIVGLPATDTLKQVSDSGSILSTLDRKHIWMAQTPQVFRHALIRSAHESAIDKQITMTDDAALIEPMDIPVYFIQGTPYNIKITTKADLQLAEAILTCRLVQSLFYT